MVNQYNLYTQVTISAIFKVDGIPTDPTTLTLTIEKPDGTKVIKALADVVKDGTGTYHFDIIVDQPHNWCYQWKGTGVVAMDETYFTVRPSEIRS